jgi:transposase
MLSVIHRCCCGLDVHKDTVVACLLKINPEGEFLQQTRTFKTVLEGLQALDTWLREEGCPHVAMESTGVFWKPVYNVLADGGRTVWVINAAQIKGLPGRKTDVGDAEWLASLLQHGLVRPSFIPDQAQRELRDLTRTRTTLQDERSASVQRLQKVLEDANLKLSSVVTDILGASGRAILEALLAGTTDPTTLAELAKGRLRKKREALEKALAGTLKTHHHLLVSVHLEHIDFLDETIERLDGEIAERLRPFEAQIARLDTIPGVGERTAQVLAAEIGLRMSQFPSAGHLASWAGMCPGNQQSGGTRKNAKTRKGSKFLRRALIEAAHAAARTKGSSFAARYRRLAYRRGKPKAAVAIGHAILTTAYELLVREEDYRERDLVQDELRRRARIEKRAVEDLEKLGFQVTLTPHCPAA